MLTKRTVVTICLLTAVLGAGAQQLAFPGAEGFAAYASGGRGGTVVHVTNLNASGAGSLAEAVSQSGRYVVFDVGGVIDITGTSITIASNVTIAGQTAPGEGITIYGGRVIASKAKNVIIRYIRMRGGKSVNQSKCTLTLDECQNLIMDHCTVSWGPWDNVHITNASDITWQHCIIAEGIEPQRFGAITDGTRNWTIAHCLWIDNKSRNPKMKCYLQYYNNVVYNFGMGIIGGHSAADNYQDVMNNYFIAGPSGSQKYFDDWTATDHLYSTGNRFDGNCNGRLDGVLITDYNSATPMSQPYYATTHPMRLLTADEAYADVVEQAGASKRRDAHDLRYIGQLTSLGTRGSFIANEDELGGIGTLDGGIPIVDSDHDGMPDDWEREHGLDPSRNDATAYTFGNGYMNIENYANDATQKSSALMYPTNLTVTPRTSTRVLLQWTNTEPSATAIVVEMSTDNVAYTEVKRISPTATSYTISSLVKGQLYYFRLKYICGDDESPYSAVVAINDEFMKPGGGTPAGQRTFRPAADAYYRIINYASRSYNSEANMTGPPKYLKLLDNGCLGVPADYDWTDESLLWRITAVEGGYTLQHKSTGLYFSPTNMSIGGVDRIGTSTQASVFTITYTGDDTPPQANSAKALSFYRINSDAAGGQQIRARSFADDWIWGSGTLSRADMIFTFGEATGFVPTCIGETKNEELRMKNNDAIYDLQGRLVGEMKNEELRMKNNSNVHSSFGGAADILHSSFLSPGLYIVGGRKILVK